jgi:hypothetical protein
MRTPGDWNLVILPWALENWLAINSLTVTKPESVCVQLLSLRVCVCVTVLTPNVSTTGPQDV